MKFDEGSEKEKGYLLGLFEGDGYAHQDIKNRHYTIAFYLNSIKDKDILKFLLKIFFWVGLKPYVLKDK